MKKKLLILFLALALAAASLFGCSGDGTTPPEGDGTSTGGNKDYSSYVWGGEYDPVFIIDRATPQAQVNQLYSAVSKATLFSPEYYYQDDAEIIDEGPHQIVIGNNTGRAITKKALRKLRQVQRDKDSDVGYLVYASGGSVAIVADDDIDNFGFIEGVAAFVKDYVDGNAELKLTSGVVLSGKVDPIAFYEESDKRYYEEQWAKLEEKIGGETGRAIVEAFQEMYKIYDHSVVTWFANLYDPGVGGFYYSNSARDNGSYAPDSESTCQALGFVSHLGKVRSWRTGKSGDYSYTLSEQRKNEIVIYIKSLQDENGFFYNYQWDKASTDAKTSRRARDLSWCLSILSTLGAKPTYTTPTGVKGDGKVVEGTYDPTILMQGPSHVGTSTVTAVSKAILAASYATHLESHEALEKYLLNYEASSTSFYAIGNTITSQMSQVIARDNDLRNAFYADPANEGKQYVSMCTMIIDFFNRNQDPETGLWGHNAKAPANYLGVNGLLKISGVYNSARAEIPYAEKAAKAAIDAITSDEVMGAVVDLYNTWFGVSNVLSNLSNYGSTQIVDGVEMTGKERAAKIREGLREIAAPAIIKSGVKISDFKKPDGSYSYTKIASSATSQGMPVAVPGTNEGDVNATVIATNGLVGNIYSALGLSMVGIYGEADLRIFLDIFENLDPVIKHTPLVALDDEPITFDDHTVGDTFCDINVNVPEGGVTVEKDTRPGASGNTVRIQSNGTGAGGYIYSKNNAAKKDGECAIFETDICVWDTTPKNYVFQIKLGSSYMFDIAVDDRGVIVREATTESYATSRYTEAAVMPLNTWFKLRVEFYKNGLGGEQRACIYINGELKIVTDGFFGMAKKADGTYGGTVNRGSISQTTIYKMMAAKFNISFDNVYTTTKNEQYKIPVDPENKLVYNIDKGKSPTDIPEA